MILRGISALVAGLCLGYGLQAADRIHLSIDNSRRVTLPGNVSPRIRSGVDLGPVDSSMELPGLMLVLKPSAAQQADLDQLLVQQQDPALPAYHQWLTPEQFGDRFGASAADIDKLRTWLQESGFTVRLVARARNAIAFSGAAGKASSAFGVGIHRYLVDGEPRFANAGDPTIPAALQDVVLAIRGLHDFRLKPRARPRYTIAGVHYLGPADIATIYDITPLYNAGIDGTGQKIVVTGQTDIEMSDIEHYRTFYGLPANDPTVILVPGSADPGVNNGDLGESDLDLELAGAAAPNATILFVNSSADFGFGGVFESLYYAIEENLAPVISISYGDCELDIGSGFAQTLQSWGMQANAQGQTIFAASGDAGAADCVGIGDGPAIDNALSVDLPGSLPQVTDVGGTEFSDASGTYWNTTNGTGQVSARSYIPEVSWNDSVSDNQPSASGGGVSAFFLKPSWQTGTGVPNDNARDVPDVSISASADNDSYYIYSGGSFQAIGGTSVGGPQFAGFMALLSQYLIAHGYQTSANLGNVNATLYPLAAVPGVFHDITSGTNIVNPCLGQRNCSASPIGYSATAGFDLVTGLGTPDVNNLVTAWHAHSLSGKNTAAIALAASVSSLTFSGSTVLTASVTGAGGGTPTGTVAYSTSGNLLGTATLNGSAVATLNLTGVQLAAGANSITASYSGDNSYYGEAADASVTVTSPTNGTPVITNVTNAASYAKTYAAGGILSVFGTNLAPATGGATSVPLPTMLAGTTVLVNGYSAAFYYVSSTQLNLQVPFEVSTGASETLVTLTVNNNGLTVDYSFYVAAGGPAIFTTNAQGTGQGAILNLDYQLVDASHPAIAGSTYLQIYCTGLGAVDNTPADGAAAPSNPLAHTSVTPQVTIGGVQVTPTFSGLAPGYVGLYQVDALVPAGITANSAVPVIVSLGTANSNTVTIAVGP